MCERLRVKTYFLELNKQNLEVVSEKMRLSQELRHRKRELKETKKELTVANHTISSQDEAIKDVNTQEVEKGVILLSCNFFNRYVL